MLSTALAWAMHKMKIYANGFDDMAKMATMVIYGKTLYKSSPEPEGLRTWYVVFGMWDLPCLFK